MKQITGEHIIVQQNSLAAVIRFLTDRECCGAGLKLIGIIVRDFFFIQFQQAITKKRPVVWVDHELDDLVPFVPAKVKTYLSFSHLWVKSIYYLYKTCRKGPCRRQVLSDIAAFMDDLASLYKAGAEVYNRCHSTTIRPSYYKGFFFKVIHLLDPHLNCIPSLHVCVVYFNYIRIHNLLEKYEKQVKDEKQAELEEVRRFLWERAQETVNSILFIKQHSANCVAAGLFTLTVTVPEFDQALGETVIDSLFTLPPDQINDVGPLKEYMKELYRFFMACYEKDISHDQVLVDFLFSLKVNQVET